MVDTLNKVVGAGGGGGDVEPDTLFTNSIGKGIFVFSEGPVGGLATGDAKSIYLNDVPLIDPTGAATAKGVSWTWRSGLPDQSYIDGYPSAVAFQNVGVNVKQATPYTVTIANGADNYDAAYVVVSIPSLVFKSAKGNLRKTNVGFQIQVRSNGGSWVTQHNVNFTAKSSSQWEGTYRVELPTGGSPWNVRLVRTIPDSDEGPKPNGEMYSNETHFARYATITDGKFTYRNTAVLGIQFNAKDYGSSVPSIKTLINGIKCYIPANYDPVTRVYATSGMGTSNGIWDGTYKSAVTDNPIWIYNDLLVNNRYGLGQDFSPNDDPETAFVDKWSLYSLAQYCDEMVSNGRGGQEPRFTINCQITSKTEAYDLLQNIISSVNGMLYFSAEQIVAVADRPQGIADAFTQADVEGGIFEYAGTALKTRHSVCIVNFKDPDNLYKTSNVIHEDPEYIQEIGYRVTEVDAFGCTSRAQALRLARWTLRTERTQTQTVTFKTGLRGGLLKPGEIIKVFDDYKTGMRTGGRILSQTVAAGNLQLELDAPVSVTTADKLVYLTADGVFKEVNFPQSFTNTANVHIPSTNPAPIDGGMYGIVFASLDGQQFKVLVIEEDDDGKYVVSALQHDPAKFAFIDSNIVLDPPRTSVISSNALSPVTRGDVAISFDELSGTQSLPKAIVSWSPPVYAANYPVVLNRGQIDDRVTSYELQLLTPSNDYETVYIGEQTSWTSGILELNSLNEYRARVRAKDQLGRVSNWYTYAPFSVKPTGTQLPPVTNLTASSILSGIVLSWDNPQDASFKNVEIRVAVLAEPPEGEQPNVPTGQALRDLYNASPIISRVVDDIYIAQNIETPNPRLFFLRTVSHNPDLPPDDPNYQLPVFAYITGVRGVLNPNDIPTPAGTIRFVDELPDLNGYDGPTVVYLKPEGVLYHIVNGQWVQLLTENGVTPVTVFPATGNEGEVIAKDGILYIWRTGQWRVVVPDLGGMAGQITSTQVANDSITTPKIAANAVTAAQIAASTITGNEIAGNTITGAHIKAGEITSGKISVVNLSSINSDLGNITGGALNIAGKFIVSNTGTVTIQSATTGPRLVLTNTQLQVYDANRLRVRLGLW